MPFDDIVSGTLSQGISAVSDVQRYADVQPKLSAGTTTHQVQQTTFGITRTWNATDAFDDCDVCYDGTTVVSLYVSGADRSISDIVVGITRASNVLNDLDGVIEVLDIRTTLVDYPLPSVDRSINADMNIVTQYILNDSVNAYPFIEGGATSPTLNLNTQFTSSLRITTGSIVFGVEKLKNMTGSVAVMGAFDDTFGVTHVTSRTMYTTERAQFTSALASLSGSSDTSLLTKKKFTSCGSSYHDSIVGTDSIAFGGLMRYRQ